MAILTASKLPEAACVFTAESCKLSRRVSPYTCHARFQRRAVIVALSRDSFNGEAEPSQERDGHTHTHTHTQTNRVNMGASPPPGGASPKSAGLLRFRVAAGMLHLKGSVREVPLL